MTEDNIAPAGVDRPPCILVTATTPADFADARLLFREYAAQLGIDLCFQQFDHELEVLESMYAPPAGALLLAHVAGTPVGCAALRPLDSGSAELKRMYVRASARGQGLGRALAGRVVELARAGGYTHLYLDTLPAMRPAQAIYEALGFADVPAYRHNPVPGARYMRLTLTSSPGTAV